MDERDVEATGERRPLTIVFSDLVRSTGLSATIDDEDYIAIIERYYAIAGDVFTNHGGYIAQHLGDGVFAWFGYPVAREGDADRAVAAGCELIARIREAGELFERKLGVHIDARVGIHSGSVVVRPLADSSVSAYGFAVNFAAKVQAAAPIGGVVLSEATLELLRASPEVRPAGDIAIAGAEGTIHIFHVVGAPPHSAPILSASPLIGRDGECERLVSSWEDAAAARGSTVVLAGTAGIGKTRLAFEVARVAEREGRVLWLRCDRLREAVSFWPVRGAILSLVGLSETDRDVRAATRVQRLLEQQPPATAAAVIRALGLDLDRAQAAPEVDARRAHNDAMDGIAALVRSLAVEEPVLLVVEDLQFADPSTAELVERLAASPHRGLLIVVTMRNEGQVETVSQFGECIELRPLDDGESATLLERLDPAHTIDVDQRKQVIDTAGGIPLFLEALVYEHARTDVTGIRRSLLPHSAVPIALQQPILARIEGANVDSSVTKAAAVIGNRFSLDVLGSVTGWTVEDLRVAMAELCRLELTVAAGNEAYEFSHPLIRDLAYDMLVAESRARLHSLTADALASQGSDAAVLAFHYEHGGRIAEAIAAGLQAGADARDSGAYREAESVLTRTIALLNETKAGADRDEQLLLAHQLRGFFRVATAPDVYRAGDEDYHASIELLRRHSPGPEMLWTLVAQWADAMYRGRLDDAVELLDMFRSIAVTSAPESLPANTGGYGIVASLRADYHEARRLLLEALEQINRDGWPDHLVRSWTTPDYPPVNVRSHLYPVFMMLGDTSAARRMATEAEEIAGALPWPMGPFSIAYTKAYQAAALGVNGDGPSVMALGGAIQQIGSERGLAFWEKLGLLYIAVGGAHMFPNEMTVSALEMTLDALKAQGSEALLLPYVSNAAATAMLATGAYDRALEVLDEAIASGRSSGIRGYEPESLRLRAQALDARAQDGEPDLRASIQLAHEQHALQFELRGLLALEQRALAPDDHRSCREAIAEVLAQVPDDSDLAEVVRARELIAV